MSNVNSESQWLEIGYDAANAVNTDSPCFVKNTLRSLLSYCCVTANSIKISSAFCSISSKIFLGNRSSAQKRILRNIVEIARLFLGKVT